jgi:uncharacterized membrane-anchored protein
MTQSGPEARGDWRSNKSSNQQAGGKMSSFRRGVSACILSAAALFAGVASAQEAPPEDPNAVVWQAALDAMLEGPRTIELMDQAKLELPEGYGFMPREHSVKVMDVMGNQTDERFIGLIFPLSDAQWFVTVDFEKSGFIKDDEAKDWDADGLLDTLREGTEQANAHREEIGVAPIKVTRWIEAPNYDAALRHLVWSAELQLKNGEDPDPGVNYNTYVLGREGYVSMCLVTSLSTVETQKPAAKQLLAAVTFNEGKRYADFNSSTDKVAAYGLGALVGGIAAKKLGLLAMAAAFLAKFAKLIIVGVVAAGAAVAKLWKKKAGADA